MSCSICYETNKEHVSCSKCNNTCCIYCNSKIDKCPYCRHEWFTPSVKYSTISLDSLTFIEVEEEYDHVHEDSYSESEVELENDSLEHDYPDEEDEDEYDYEHDDIYEHQCVQM